MVSPESPLGGPPSSNSAMRQQSSIVAPSGGSVMRLAGALRNLGWVGEIGLAPDNGARVDQGYEEFRDLRRQAGEILNVDLGCVHARPGACGTAAVRLGLSAAHDLHAVHEELGLRRYGGGGEQIAE